MVCMGQRMLGNTELVNCGIFDESPDTIRAHVGAITGFVFIFKSGDAQTLLRQRTYPLRPAYTDGIRTALGPTPAWNDIPNIKSYRIPQDLLYHARQRNGQGTSEKGSAAVYVVTNMLVRGLIPINVQILEVDNKAEQIMGIDLRVNASIKLQVKMDWKAGPKELGGSGNVYLQTQECNPFGRH